jgi:hypothetical protein
VQTADRAVKEVESMGVYNHPYSPDIYEHWMILLKSMEGSDFLHEKLHWVVKVYANLQANGEILDLVKLIVFVYIF